MAMGEENALDYRQGSTEDTTDNYYEALLHTTLGLTKYNSWRIVCQSVGAYIKQKESTHGKTKESIFPDESGSDPREWKSNERDRYIAEALARRAHEECYTYTSTSSTGTGPIRYTVIPPSW